MSHTVRLNDTIIKTTRQSNTTHLNGDTSSNWTRSRTFDRLRKQFDHLHGPMSRSHEPKDCELTSVSIHKPTSLRKRGRSSIFYKIFQSESKSLCQIEKSCEYSHYEISYERSTSAFTTTTVKKPSRSRSSCPSRPKHQRSIRHYSNLYI